MTSLVQGSQVLKRLCVYALGMSAPAFFPIAHMFLMIPMWAKYSRKVNRSTCHCDCWDTAFKGIYETGVARYKHVYFNATSNTLKIWLLTVGAVITFYECVCRIVRLFQQRRLRFSMFVLFCSSVYSHYCTWWIYFNYLNDEFYAQWYHQLLFSISELIATAMVVHLLDTHCELVPWKLAAILTVASAHTVTAMSDQFVRNVLLRQGYLHQVLRDLGFMSSDILHICIPLWEMWKLARNKHGTSQVRVYYALAVSSFVVLAFWSVSLLF